MVENEYKAHLLKTKKNVTINLLDRKILYVLSINSRLNNSSIAGILGVSKEKVSYRINRMEKFGFLEGFMTVFNMQRFNFLNYVVLIKLKNLVSKEDIIAKFDKSKEITLIQHVSGGWDLLIIISVKNYEDFYLAFEDVMGIGDNLEKYMILQQIEEDYTGLGYLLPQSERNKIELIKKNSSAFIDDFNSKTNASSYSLDEKDLFLLEKIKLNARIPLMELAKETKMTLSGVKYKLQNLIKYGFIRHFVPMYSVGDLGMQWNLIFIRTNRLHKDSLVPFFKSHPNITWFEQYIGSWNFMLSIFTKDNFNLNSVLEELKSTFKEKIISYETLTVFKQFKFVVNF